MITQIHAKYMAAVKNATGIRLEDIGAVSLALQLALDELHAKHRAELVEVDDINNELLAERNANRTQMASDAAALMRLINMEDALSAWLVANEPAIAAEVAQGADVASSVLKVLNRTKAMPAAVDIQQAEDRASMILVPPGNGKSQMAVGLAAAQPIATSDTNGHTGTAFRFKGSNEQMLGAIHNAMRTLHDRLGHTPSSTEWNTNCGSFGLPQVSGASKRLGLTYTELCQGAGLEPNVTFTSLKKGTGQEAKAENAEAPFRRP